jgi:hypothetical protein
MELPGAHEGSRGDQHGDGGDRDAELIQEYPPCEQPIAVCDDELRELFHRDRGLRLSSVGVSM